MACIFLFPSLANRTDSSEQVPFGKSEKEKPCFSGPRIGAPMETVDLIDCLRYFRIKSQQAC